MSDEGRLIRRLLEGLGEGDPFSYVVVALLVGLVTYAMWRLVREEEPPQSKTDWTRLIAIVSAGAGAIIGILGLVAAFAFDSRIGPHLALLGSALFFLGFLVALILLTVEFRSRWRENGAPGD